MQNNKRPETMKRINTPELAKAFIDEDSKRYGLIGGLNLAMLIEAYVLRQSGKPLAEVVSILEETGRYGIRRYEAGDDIDDGC